MQKTRKITETLANGYSSESSWRELSNEYQDDRVSMIFQESCILVLWTKVVSALEGLILYFIFHSMIDLKSSIPIGIGTSTQYYTKYQYRMRKKYCIEKVQYYMVLFKIENMCKIDLIANWVVQTFKTWSTDEQCCCTAFFDGWKECGTINIKNLDKNVQYNLRLNMCDNILSKWILQKVSERLNQPCCLNI